MHKKILEDIATYLQSSASARTYQDIGLLGGLGGQLLFLWQLNKQHPQMLRETFFHEQLTLIQQSLPQLQRQASFAYGLSGLAWLLDLLNLEQSGADYDASYCDELDKCILHQLNQTNKALATEFMSGLSGIAVYGVRRFERANKTAIADAVLRQIENQAHKVSPESLSWSRPQEPLPASGDTLAAKVEFDLGLAHGMVSVLAALTALAQVPDCRASAKKLLSAGCNWLLAQTLPSKGFTSSYGNFSGKDEDSRLGWCYGDLGIALTLARAGTLLKDESLIKHAKTLALNAAKRTAPGKPVIDAALCHGSSGISLLFLRLYQLLKITTLKEAADYWYRDCLQRYQANKLSGLMPFDPQSKSYQQSSGLLNGYAGIGLYLLYYQQADNSWLDALLLA
ncbi:lanthionine synthetase LanC family protein [Thalassomonas haliotis]|uniref:Lantibiotic biosynthesis protein n=1 Tax=Thalassomonas haliotis TaxID=485448 RepID=A0ABY7VAC1_9GAMM|nr:lanthionine synthetase LanC family protein [Thalassomonas haliotis]WDE10592.1 hypothetical protein H3N35_20365 [Thalassomonas haliotis]